MLCTCTYVCAYVSVWFIVSPVISVVMVSPVISVVMVSLVIFRRSLFGINYVLSLIMECINESVCAARTIRGSYRSMLCCKDYSWLVQIEAVLQGLFVARTDRSCAARTVCGSYRSMLYVLQGLFVACTDRCCMCCKDCSWLVQIDVVLQELGQRMHARDREFPPPPPLRFLYSKMATSSTSRETVAKSVPFGDFCLILEKISTTKGNDKKKGLLKKFIDRWRDGHRSLYGEGHASSANVRALVHMQ